MTNNQEPGATAPESSTQPIIYGMIPQQSGDEISLIDVFLIIKRRKKIVLFTALIFIVLSTTFALQREAVYRYSTTIEIGSRLVSNESVNIDSPATVLAKLLNGYIPLVLSESANNNVFNGIAFPEVTGSIPMGSEIIVLEVKGGEEQESAYIELLNNIINKIKEDHMFIISGIRKNIENDINTVARQVVSQKTELNMQRAMLKRQDKIAELLQQEIKSTNQTLESALESKGEALREVSEESKALTLMLLNSEIRNTQETMAKLKERLQVTLPGIKDELNKKIQDTQGLIEGLHDQKSKLTLQENSIKYTRAMTRPMRSLKEIGRKSSLIIIMGAIAGLFFGVMFVFAAELLKKVREVEGAN